MALSLGKPLLVSGEPGVGKTRLAYYAARRLGLLHKDVPEVHRFDVRSTTRGVDLLYRYDAVTHFRLAQMGDGGERANTQEHIQLQALGTGIALAADPRRWQSNEGLKRVVENAFGQQEMPYPRLSVVLIDEIDKAPRDVPNDLLRALDEMSFRIEELKDRPELTGEKTFRPLVIITTNEERTLPDAFLRRCCYLHIPFPEKQEDLEEIIWCHLGGGAAEGGVRRPASVLAGDAIRFVRKLRDNAQDIGRKPGTAELIDFMLELTALGAQDGQTLTSFAPAADVAVTVFGKRLGAGEAIRNALGVRA